MSIHNRLKAVFIVQVERLANEQTRSNSYQASIRLQEIYNEQENKQKKLVYSSEIKQAEWDEELWTDINQSGQRALSGKRPFSQGSAWQKDLGEEGFWKVPLAQVSIAWSICRKVAPLTRSSLVIGKVEETKELITSMSMYWLADNSNEFIFYFSMFRKIYRF